MDTGKQVRMDKEFWPLLGVSRRKIRLYQSFPLIGTSTYRAPSGRNWPSDELFTCLHLTFFTLFSPTPQ